MPVDGSQVRAEQDSVCYQQVRVNSQLNVLIPGARFSSGELICGRCPKEIFSLKQKSDRGKTKAAVRGGVPEAVSAAIAAMTDQLKSGELKPTVAEFVRLLDLQRELIAEDVRHIKVTWVDSLNGTESTTEV